MVHPHGFSFNLKPSSSQDIPIIARDATFLISLAAEEFIKRLCQAGQKAAEKERRTTVQHKDLGEHRTLEFISLLFLTNNLDPATVVRRADEFMFLDGSNSLQKIHLYSH